MQLMIAWLLMVFYFTIKSYEYCCSECKITKQALQIVTLRTVALASRTANTCSFAFLWWQYFKNKNFAIYPTTIRL